MTEHDERSAFAPRLPKNPAYWSALAERITRGAEPVFAERRARQVWWNPLARFGPALGVGAIAAVVATFVVLSAGDPAATSPGPPGGMPVRPTDLLENAFTTPSMPDVVTLMVLGNEE